MRQRVGQRVCGRGWGRGCVGGGEAEGEAEGVWEGVRQRLADVSGSVVHAMWSRLRATRIPDFTPFHMAPKSLPW